MNKLYTEITRLHDHPGFPNGSNLLCPVFTQDKYKYLQALMPKGMCNPTLKVDFLPVMDYESIKEDVLLGHHRHPQIHHLLHLNLK